MILKRTIAALLCALLVGSAVPAAASPQDAARVSAQNAQAASSPAVEASIMAVGDIMFHSAQITAAYDSKTKSWSFDDSFRYVRDILSGADLALGNFECTLAGTKKPWSQPMSFNVPDAAADALAAAGFDVLSTANNHTNDRGRDGLIRTVTTLRGRGITAVGTRKDASEKPYAIVNVKGIKIGVTAYTFGTRNGDLLNLYSTNVAVQKPKFDAMVKAMRADGADIVLFYIHWGAEYQRAPNASQKKLAQALSDAGVDIICGSHPHVLQSVDTLTGSGGNKTVVAWSLGDFISNQITRWDPTMFKYTEDEMILHLTLRKADGKTTVKSVEYLPVWNMYTKVKGKVRYNVVPIEKALKNPTAYGMPSSYERNKAALALKNTNALLADAVKKGIITKMVLP